MTGCRSVLKIAVAPDHAVGEHLVGVDGKVSVPQEAGANATGLADADVRNTTVTLPEGVQLNPWRAMGCRYAPAIQARCRWVGLPVRAMRSGIRAKRKSIRALGR